SDASIDGASPDASSPDALSPDAASPDAPIDAPHGDGATEAGPDAFLACGELPARDLQSIDDVKAVLRASPPFPFPRGWGPCPPTSLAICPPTYGDISFDAALTTLLCGGNFESGFHTHATFPMTIADTGTKTSSGAPIFELQVTAEAGVKHYQLAAQGQ